MDTSLPLLRARFSIQLAIEITKAYGKHGNEQWSRHEFYAVLKEEVDELWDAIKLDKPQKIVYDELIQVAAVCLRYFETRDRYREPADETRD